MEVARLLVEVDANTAAAEAGIASLHNKLALGALAFGVIGVAAVGAAVLATKAAGDFQQGLTTLVTGAGLAQGDMNKVGDAIKQMAVDTGTSTKQLIAGMYMISSAGFDTSHSLNILQAAAQGAKVGNADLGTVADAVTTIMKDYPGVVNGAAGAVNFLVATVAHGKTHMQDLAQSLAMVLPTASVAKIGLADVMGAMATMTAKGVPAANAATYLRQTILSLMAPGAQAKKALDSIGLSSTQVANEMQKSMPAALQMIIDHLSKKFKPGSAEFIAALKDISGGSKTAQGMMLLAGQGTDLFRESVKKVADQVKKGGTHIQGWSDIQKDFNFQMSKAREMLETAFITIGEHLLPVLTNVVKFITANAMPAVKNLTQFWKDHQGIIIAVAILIGGALAASFVVWAVTAGAAAIATLAATWPVLLIGAAIAGLIALLVLAYTHWGWFHDAVNHIPPVLGAVKDAIGWVIGKLGDLLGVLGHVKDAISGAFGHLGDLIGKFGSLHNLPGFASGTNFTPGGAFVGAEGEGPELLLTPGVYTAPKGSTVLNARDTAKVLGGAGTQGQQKSQTVNIYPQKADLNQDDLARHLRRAALLANTSGGY